MTATPQGCCNKIFYCKHLNKWDPGAATSRNFAFCGIFRGILFKTVYIISYILTDASCSYIHYFDTVHEKWTSSRTDMWFATSSGTAQFNFRSSSVPCTHGGHPISVRTPQHFAASLFSGSMNISPHYRLLVPGDTSVLESSCALYTTTSPDPADFGAILLTP